MYKYEDGDCQRVGTIQARIPHSEDPQRFKRSEQVLYRCTSNVTVTAARVSCGRVSKSHPDTKLVVATTEFALGVLKTTCITVQRFAFCAERAIVSGHTVCWFSGG